MRAVLIATNVYFGLVFGTGFILGAGRVSLLLPAVGERAAELVEAPIMIVVIFFSARFVLRRFVIPSQLSSGLTIGFGALLLLLAVELTVVLRLRGLTIGEYLSNRDPIAGAVYVASLFVFAFAPAILSCVSRLPSKRSDA